MKVKLLIDKQRCKGCVWCARACRLGLLEMSDDLNRGGYHFPEMRDADSCTGCGQCAEMCPDMAIEIEENGQCGKRKARSGKRLM